MSHKVHGFQMPESKSVPLPIFFPFRISSAFCPEEYRDKRCPFPSRVCKGVGEAGFKHSEQTGKMTGSYGMTYQIAWKGVPVLSFLTAKKTAGLFTEGKTKLSAEQIEEEILGPPDLLCPYSHLPLQSTPSSFCFASPPQTKGLLLLLFSTQPCKLMCHFVQQSSAMALRGTLVGKQKASPKAQTLADPGLPVAPRLRFLHHSHLCLAHLQRHPTRATSDAASATVPLTLLTSEVCP